MRDRDVRTRGIALAGALSTVLTLTGAPAFASQRPADPPLELRWSAPADCGSEPEVRAAVGTLLSQASEPSAVRAHARLRTSPSGLTVRLDVRSELGEDRYRFSADSCALAVEAVALVLAVTVDPNAAGRQVAPDTTQTPTRAELLAAVRRALEADADPARHGDELALVPLLEPYLEDDAPATDRQWILRAEGGFGHNPTDANGFARASTGMRYGKWATTLGVGWLPNRRGHFDGGVAPINLRSVFGEARQCWMPGGDSWEVPLCVALEAGSARAFHGGSAARRPWLAALIGVGVAWRFHRHWSFGLRGELATAVLRPRFALREPDVRRDAPAVGVRAVTGMTLHLGGGR